MEKTADLDKLLTQIDKISEIEKCRTCQCFYDALLEFKEVLGKGKNNEEMRQKLSGLIESSEVAHNCLGCDPCLPVPVSNALAEIMGTSFPKTCNPVCKPLLVLPIKRTAALYPEQGEFFVGNEKCSVAISTLCSDDLSERIATHLGSDNFAIVGKTHTENIGIEKVIKNTVSNPHIRFIVLCGKDSRGHMAGQSIISLFQDGVSYDKRIIGSKGQRPILKNLELMEIEHFRSQVEIVNLMGSEDSGEIKERVHACMEQNREKYDKELSVKKKPLVEAHTPTKLILDPSGFFIIYPKKDEGKIYLEHYLTDGTLNETIYGEDPVSITSTAIERGLVSRVDHAAYLGRELEKAYLSICYGFPYIQDSAPGH